ncbi:MAG: AMP-dependent synthetase [Marmoricola sp.]|nr:AMP-dependent synthetase [Marmoricola sp.]
MQVLSAGDSERQQRGFAGSLRSAGLRAGDRVAFVLTGSTALVSATLGALRTGVVPVMFDPALPSLERAAMLADADPALVVESQSALEALIEGDPVELSEFPLARPMHYTSGTTGRRKGVWSGLLDDEGARSLVAEEQVLWGFRPEDRHLVVSPLHHSAPLRFAAGTLLAGGQIAVVPRFDGQAFIAALAQVRPTSIFCAPAHLQRLFAEVDEGAPLPDLSGVRLVAHAGAPCPEPLKRRLIDTFPDGSVWEFYGSTEGQFTACSAADWISHPGTVGRARPGRAITVDADGTIWCAAPPYARFSYWRDPEKTQRSWRQDAFTVGDLGRLDDEGFLYLDGRRDDLLLSGGVNVYPLEVEQAFASCPGVAEIAVFGRADDRWGQRVCAAYVGTAAGDDLKSWAMARLLPASRPKEYHQVAVLPTTSAGKIRRTTLAADLGLGADDVDDDG